ncbi:KICSTOR complex protein ITFG2-like isoform X2 [Rhopilema esculentum]|uniref:KICSTOR complex protein ITFG2-like isoform X2 n=1 Tax=Rhopilema esculentum TaxID=499914 RepID=UPI0031DA3211
MESLYRRSRPVSVKDAKSSPVHSGSILIKPSFIQEMPANPKMATVCDIDGDGQMELIVAYSDRYVRVFKFKHILHERKHSNLLLERKQSKDEFQDLNKKSESKLSKQPSKEEEGKPMLSKLGKQPSKDSESNRSPSPMSPINSNKEQRFTYDSSTSGSFEKVDEYYLPGQVGSVAVVKCGESKTKLVASQPGGGYVILGEYNTGCPKDSQLLHANSLKTKGKPSEPEQLHVLYTNQGYPGRNFNVNCEVTGSIKRENQVSGLFGLFTVDGFFALVDASFEYNHLLPAVKITEHQWFHMSTLEFMEGNDDVILCSWEGVTYIINKDFEVACYDYGCNICGFDAGFYATDSQKNSPCFCYVTYSNKVVLYYNIDSIYQKSERLDEVLLEKLTGRPELNGILTTLVDEKGKIDNTKLMKLLQSTSRDST